MYSGTESVSIPKNLHTRLCIPSYITMSRVLTTQSGLVVTVETVPAAEAARKWLTHGDIALPSAMASR